MQGVSEEAPCLFNGGKAGKFLLLSPGIAHFDHSCLKIAAFIWIVNIASVAAGVLAGKKVPYSAFTV